MSIHSHPVVCYWQRKNTNRCHKLVRGYLKAFTSIISFCSILALALRKTLFLLGVFYWSCGHHFLRYVRLGRVMPHHGPAHTDWCCETASPNCQLVDWKNWHNYVVQILSFKPRVHMIDYIVFKIMTCFAENVSYVRIYITRVTRTWEEYVKKVWVNMQWSILGLTLSTQGWYCDEAPGKSDVFAGICNSCLIFHQHYGGCFATHVLYQTASVG